MAGPQPVVPSGYDIYLDTFFKLNSERQNREVGIASIPTLKVIEYAGWLSIENVSEFVDIILRVDTAFVNQISEQIKRQMQQAAKGT